MTTPVSVTKGEFAALRGVSAGRVSQWISEKKIQGSAIDGEGRNARIVVEEAYRQLGVTLDPVQSVANGQQASMPLDAPPAPAAQQSEAFTDQRRFAKIKADQAEMAYEKQRRDFDAETGRYMLTEFAEHTWSRIFGKVISDLEAALPTMAMEIARQIPNADPKQVTIALRTSFRNWRSKIAAIATIEVENAEPYLADPARQQDAGSEDRRPE